MPLRIRWRNSSSGARQSEPGYTPRFTARHGRVDGESFDDDQIVSILRNWTAGHGTVAAGLGILVLHLAQEFELQDRLRNDTSLIAAAIEEILRVDGPLVANRRITTREV